MIRLIYEPSEEMKEFTVDKVEIKATEVGHINEYTRAFAIFLRACGFAEGTIAKTLPTYIM